MLVLDADHIFVAIVRTSKILYQPKIGEKCCDRSRCVLAKIGHNNCVFQISLYVHLVSSMIIKQLNSFRSNHVIEAGGPQNC